MSEKTEISWTDATFNPWWGCAKVSPACDHCYAERDSKRYQPGKVLWGVDAERREFGDKHWHAPVSWNARAEREGKRTRVFCASMADVFDKNAPEGARDRLWQLVVDTPSLDWQLLTKRIGNVAHMVPPSWQIDGWPTNVWLGATVINQEEADRDVPKLLAIPARVRFLSIEPMLGQITLDRWLWTCCGNMQSGSEADGMPGGTCCNQPERAELIDWVIAGGESGPHARPPHPDWFRKLRDQCGAAGVAYHFKQHGEWMPAGSDPNEVPRLTIAYARPTVRCYSWPDGETLLHVGKKAAGWLLDGVEHKAFPGSTA